MLVYPLANTIQKAHGKLTIVRDLPGPNIEHASTVHLHAHVHLLLRWDVINELHVRTTGVARECPQNAAISSVLQRVFLQRGQNLLIFFSDSFILDLLFLVVLHAERYVVVIHILIEF